MRNNNRFYTIKSLITDYCIKIGLTKFYVIGPERGSKIAKLHILNDDLEKFENIHKNNMFVRISKYKNCAFTKREHFYFCNITSNN